MGVSFALLTEGRTTMTAIRVPCRLPLFGPVASTAIALRGVDRIAPRCAGSANVESSSVPSHAPRVTRRCEAQGAGMSTGSADLEVEVAG